VTPNRRMLLWSVAVAATLAAVAWVSNQDEDIAAPVAARDLHGDGGRPAARPGKAGKELPELSLAGLDARGLDEMKTDLFASKSWYVPPPPPPPPKPTAPPLPFTFLGRLIEGDQAAVFVSSGDRNQVLRVGDVVGGAWRVDAIEPTRMKFTYLPLNENQYLALGAAP
jgi:hypothetical protein